MNTILSIIRALALGFCICISNCMQTNQLCGNRVIFQEIPQCVDGFHVIHIPEASHATRRTIALIPETNQTGRQDCTCVVSMTPDDPYKVQIDATSCVQCQGHPDCENPGTGSRYVVDITFSQVNNFIKLDFSDCETRNLTRMCGRTYITLDQEHDDEYLKLSIFCWRKRVTRFPTTTRIITAEATTMTTVAYSNSSSPMATIDPKQYSGTKVKWTVIGVAIGVFCGIVIGLLIGWLIHYCKSKHSNKGMKQLRKLAQNSNQSEHLTHKGDKENQPTHLSQRMSEYANDHVYFELDSGMYPDHIIEQLRSKPMSRQLSDNTVLVDNTNYSKRADVEAKQRNVTGVIGQSLDNPTYSIFGENDDIIRATQPVLVRRSESETVDSNDNIISQE